MTIPNIYNCVLLPQATTKINKKWLDVDACNAFKS